MTLRDEDCSRLTELVRIALSHATHNVSSPNELIPVIERLYKVVSTAAACFHASWTLEAYSGPMSNSSSTGSATSQTYSSHLPTQAPRVAARTYAPAEALFDPPQAQVNPFEIWRPAASALAEEDRSKSTVRRRTQPVVPSTVPRIHAAILPPTPQTPARAIPKEVLSLTNGHSTELVPSSSHAQAKATHFSTRPLVSHLPVPSRSLPSPVSPPPTPPPRFTSPSVPVAGSSRAQPAATAPLFSVFGGRSLTPGIQRPDSASRQRGEDRHVRFDASASASRAVTLVEHQQQILDDIAARKQQVSATSRPRIESKEKVERVHKQAEEDKEMQLRKQTIDAMRKAG